VISCSGRLRRSKAHAHRLGQIIVGAELERTYANFFGALGAYNQDGQAPIGLAQLADDLEAPQARQAQVKNHQVGLRRYLHCIQPVGCQQGSVTLVFQRSDYQMS
jgi:hypothetical protein